MAVTKIKPIKMHVEQSPLIISKTRIRQTGKRLCPPLGAAMKRQILSLNIPYRRLGRKRNNLAFHLIQSFEPGEVDCEKAHTIGKQLADAATKGQHEYVLTTHIDKGHIHNHINFLCGQFRDYHKYEFQ